MAKDFRQSSRRLSETKAVYAPYETTEVGRIFLMTVLQETVCPGCGLKMPANKNPNYRSYYRTNAECWDLYTEVLGTEYSNAILFGQVHQLTVDTYAVQHAGEPHPVWALSRAGAGDTFALHTAVASASRHGDQCLAPL